jgi:hypothetical protein
MHSADALAIRPNRNPMRRPMRKRRLSTVEMMAGLLFAATLPAPSALAAPFCLQTQSIPPQCIYFDASNCRRDATQQRGFCIVNPQEVALAPGVGAYCMVTSGGAAVCAYQDIRECSREALHQDAVCVEAPPGIAGNTPDPYQSMRSGDEASQGTNRP